MPQALFFAFMAPKNNEKISDFKSPYTYNLWSLLNEPST